MRLSWLDQAGASEAPGEAPAGEVPDDEAPPTGWDLAGAGVLYQRLPLAQARREAALAALCAARGYGARDEACLAAGAPLEAFAGEHAHAEDEVRLVLEGGGIFDIRSVDDRWMRAEVGPGDLLVIPAGRYHRFSLGARGAGIRCVRLFKSAGGWVPVYRPGG